VIVSGLDQCIKRTHCLQHTLHGHW